MLCHNRSFAVFDLAEVVPERELFQVAPKVEPASMIRFAPKEDTKPSGRNAITAGGGVRGKVINAIRVESPERQS
jgi:hypothetical protein